MGALHHALGLGHARKPPGTVRQKNATWTSQGCTYCGGGGKGVYKHKGEKLIPVKETPS